MVCNVHRVRTENELQHPKKRLVVIKGILIQILPEKPSTTITREGKLNLVCLCVEYQLFNHSLLMTFTFTYISSKYEPHGRYLHNLHIM
jgi:hypothetical protein